MFLRSASAHGWTALALCGLALFADATAAAALRPLATPRGAVLLSVSGRISVRNAPGRADFDCAMLQALGMETLNTTSRWTDGVQHFTGVRLSRLLAAVGARGRLLRAVALNDFAAEIPIADAFRWPVLIAFERNGKPMPVHDKGPLWIVYPRDADPVLRDNPVYKDRWVWQLRRLEVRR